MLGSVEIWAAHFPGTYRSEVIQVAGIQVQDCSELEMDQEIFLIIINNNNG